MRAYIIREKDGRPWYVANVKGATDDWGVLKDWEWTFDHKQAIDMNQQAIDEFIRDCEFCRDEYTILN